MNVHCYGRMHVTGIKARQLCAWQKQNKNESVDVCSEYMTLSACLHFIFWRMYLCVSVDLSVFFSSSMLLLLPLFVVCLYSARMISQPRNALDKCYLLSLL